MVWFLARATSWYAEQQRVPVLVRSVFKVGRGIQVSSAEDVLPPTLHGWRRFLELAPGSGLKFAELDECAAYWWDRKLPRGILADAREAP